MAFELLTLSQFSILNSSLMLLKLKPKLHLKLKLTLLTSISANQNLNVFFLELVHFAHLTDVVFYRVIFDDDLFSHLEFLFSNRVLVLSFFKILPKYIFLVTNSRWNDHRILEFFLHHNKMYISDRVDQILLVLFGLLDKFSL